MSGLKVVDKGREEGRKEDEVEGEWLSWRWWRERGREEDEVKGKEDVGLIGDRGGRKE